MKLKMRTTLIAGAIAALLAGPIWAASDTPKDGAQAPAPTKAEIGQPERDQPTAAQPMSETPRMGAAAYGGATARTPIGDNPLYTRSADDLDGVEVVDRTGDKVGDVKQIVLAPDRKSAHAVISVGGILGMGARDIMVSLDELRPMDDKLQMSATKEEIESLKDQAPDADRYVEVKGDTPISGSIVEFSAVEQGKETNKPGRLERKDERCGSLQDVESENRPGIARKYGDLDVAQPARIADADGFDHRLMQSGSGHDAAFYRERVRSGC